MATTPTGRAPAVSCVAVTKSFDALPVLDAVDVEVAPGTVTALVGPSGCGKSTLLRIIAGLETPTDGVVAIGGSPPAALRDRGEIAVAFQDPALLPWRTVRSNVALARRLARQPPAPQQVQHLLELVGLAGFERVKPAELSGGMRQRRGDRPVSRDPASSAAPRRTLRGGGRVDAPAPQPRAVSHLAGSGPLHHPAGHPLDPRGGPFVGHHRGDVRNDRDGSSPSSPSRSIGLDTAPSCRVPSFTPSSTRCRPGSVSTRNRRRALGVDGPRDGR